MDNWESSRRGKDVQSITATVASSALTTGLNPTVLDFRSSTLGNGVAVSRVIATALSLIVPSSATLGTTDTVQSKIMLLAIDNSGSIELAVVNFAGGNNLDETTLITTVAIDATADTNNIFYSETARTNVPFRVIGYIESTQAVAGAWDTAPSTIQGQGGNNTQPSYAVSSGTAAIANDISGEIVDQTHMDWSNAGGMTQGAVISEVEFSQAVASLDEMMNTNIYIPSNANSLEYKGKMYISNGTYTNTIRLRVASANGTAIQTSITAYDWVAGTGTLDVSAESGWTKVFLDMSTSNVAATAFVKSVDYRVI